VTERGSWTPPAGGEDPIGVGVEEAPGEDGSGDKQKAEGLIAAEDAALDGAALCFVDGLKVGPDAGFDHGGLVLLAGAGWLRTEVQYRAWGLRGFRKETVTNAVRLA